MNVWFDIYHIPQLNYYSQFIKMLSAKGHTIYMTVLDRGRNVKIARKEFNSLPGVKIWVIGKHRMTKWSVLFEANLLRIIHLFFWALPKHIDISFSNGFQHGFIAKFKGQPAYSFHDDPDAGDHKMMNRFCTLNHALLYCLPDGYQLHQKDKLMPSLKEWAYLNPKVFEPHVDALEIYGIRPKEYIFLREVSVGTFNYSDQPSGCILAVAPMIEQLKTADGKPMKVLFSLEEKSRRDAYPKDWILLQEPLNDIHSLIYYSAGLVSSGDSMAREASLMGIPSYYLGKRYTMPANLAAAKVAGLENEKTMEFTIWLQTLHGTPDELQERQEAKRAEIDKEFIDVNQYMMDLVESVKK